VSYSAVVGQNIKHQEAAVMTVGKHKLFSAGRGVPTLLASFALI